MKSLEFFQKYGYTKDYESIIRDIGNHCPNSNATQTANQIKHLKEVLKELVSIVEIHSRATGNNFAWAELEEAKIALNPNL